MLVYTTICQNIDDYCDGHWHQPTQNVIVPSVTTWDDRVSKHDLANEAENSLVSQWMGNITINFNNNKDEANDGTPEVPYEYKMWTAREIQ